MRYSVNHDSVTVHSVASSYGVKQLD